VAIDHQIRFIQCQRCKPLYNSCCCKVCEAEHLRRREELDRERTLITNRAMEKRRRKLSLESMESNKQAQKGRKVDEPSEVASSEKAAKNDHAYKIDGALQALTAYSER
jgi:hypothetical protein